MKTRDKICVSGYLGCLENELTEIGSYQKFCHIAVLLPLASFFVEVSPMKL